MLIILSGDCVKIKINRNILIIMNTIMEKPRRNCQILFVLEALHIFGKGLLNILYIRYIVYEQAHTNFILVLSRLAKCIYLPKRLRQIKNLYDSFSSWTETIAVAFWCFVTRYLNDTCMTGSKGREWNLELIEGVTARR